jgi:shikimate kinase
MRPVAVLIGPPASGKSKLGKSVARMLGLPFVDTDKRVVEKHGPIVDIFRQRGVEQFRQWERHEVARALTEGGIVALGGGAIEDSETQADLAAHRVVLVTVSAEAVESRIANDNRPLLDGIDSWISLVEKRMPIYERLADIRVDTSVGPMDMHAADLANRLEASS